MFKASKKMDFPNRAKYFLALFMSSSTLAHAKVRHPVSERCSSIRADANLDSAGGGRPSRRLSDD